MIRIQYLLLSFTFKFISVTIRAQRSLTLMSLLRMSVSNHKFMYAYVNVLGAPKFVTTHAQLRMHCGMQICSWKYQFMLCYLSTFLTNATKLLKLT